MINALRYFLMMNWRYRRYLIALGAGVIGAIVYYLGIQMHYRAIDYCVFLQSDALFYLGMPAMFFGVIAYSFGGADNELALMPVPAWVKVVAGYIAGVALPMVLVWAGANMVLIAIDMGLDKVLMNKEMLFYNGLYHWYPYPINVDDGWEQQLYITQRLLYANCFLIYMSHTLGVVVGAWHTRPLWQRIGAGVIAFLFTWIGVTRIVYGLSHNKQIYVSEERYETIVYATAIVLAAVAIAAAIWMMRRNEVGSTADKVAE